MARYLRRGAAAGFAAGLCLAIWLRVLGEPWIDAAVRFEKAHETGSAHADMFSRSTQHLGGMIGAGLYGLALGVIFSVVFAAIRHRLFGTDWHRSVHLAAAGFVALFLVPFLKYPANPPSVGDPNTITRRTELYLLLLTWSIVSTWAAWRLHRQLVTRGLPDHHRAPLVAATFVVLVGVAYLIFPANTDPVRPPANLIWHFRVASASSQLAYCAVLGGAFGLLCVRSARSTAQPVRT
jgi:predicted cobalt transporter CbtA